MRAPVTALLVLAVCLVACKTTPPPSSDEVAVPPVTSGAPSPVRPREPAAAHDGGIGAPCEGEEVDLLAAVLDERCALRGGAWQTLADRPAAGLVQTAAALVADGGVAVLRFRLENHGAAPVDVPVRLRPGRPDLAAFTVLAEGPAGAVDELAPPAFDGAPGVEPAADAGLRPFGTRGNPTRRARDPRALTARDGGDEEMVHSARIRILPGGAASALLRLDPTIARRLGPADAGAAPTRVRGHAVLHVGQLFAPVAAGEPARVGFDFP